MKSERRKTIISIIHGSIFMLSSFVLLIISFNEDLVLIDKNIIWIIYVVLGVSFISIILSLIFNVILNKNSSKISDLISLTNVIPFAITISLILSTFVFFSARVVGRSMEPTFYDGESIIVSKVSKIEVGDILVISKPTEDDYLLIKRLVAKEGDTITVTEKGIVYVNGELINNIESSYKAVEFNDYTLKEGEYYCLGDNRGNSLDSRAYGLFSNNELKGEVVLRLNPFTTDFNQ